MLLTEALIRFSAITMLIYLAITAVRDIKPSRCWPYLAFASLSTAALFFSLTSTELALPRRLSLLSGFLNVPHLVFIWLFALSVFQTKFRLSIWHILIGFAYCFPIFWFRAYEFDLSSQPPFVLTLCVSIGSALLMAHLIWVILRERNFDLMEKRKRSRLIFVSALVVVTVLTAIVDLYLIAASPPSAHLIKASTIWPAIAAAFLWIIRGSSDSFVTNKAPRTFSSVQSQISAKDTPLFQALRKRMKDDRVYLDPCLTISQLGKDLGVTSHRLRALINQLLGYENFNQFLNTYRISYIVAQFDDDSNQHLSIMTISLDSGFKSLAPFNKAFKEIMGQTPSQYRKSKAQSCQ